MIRQIRLLLTEVGATRRLILVGILATFTAVFEAIAALVVLVLLQVMLNPESPISFPLLGDVRPFLPDPSNTDGTIWFTIAVAGFFVIQALVNIGETYVQQRFAHGVAAKLSVRLIDGYLHLPYAFHLDKSSAELIRNAHDAAQRLGGQVVLPLIRLFAETAMLLAVLAVLVVAAPLATAFVVIVLTPLLLILMRVIQPRLKRLGRTSHRMAGESISILQQSLGGIRDVLLFDRRRHFVNRYARARRRLARSHYLNGTLAELPRSALQTTMLVLILGFFAFAIATDRSTAETLATLGLFAYAGFRMQPSLQKIIVSVNNLKFSAPIVEDIMADTARFSAQPRLPEADPSKSTQAGREIRLSQVTYFYPDTPAPALADVTLTIGIGTSVGLCGPTGGGKTTLVDLIVGLLEPTEGSITVDGVDILDCLAPWQRQIGMVSQNMFLLDDTLRHNIAFGIADVDDDALREAIQIAQLEEFVGSLPQGLETRVGERGVKLSGGQRQRVAIARAFYRRPKILVFDEGTSALDNVTESRLMESFASDGESRTVILVAHRLSTVRGCDVIYYVDHGRILTQGTFEELLETSSEFRALASSR